jgi:hypothetical protein
MFHKYVASVSYGCCKSRSRFCICCNGCARMLQSFCFQCFIYFFIRMLQVCLSRCYICFTHMLHVFHLDVACTFAMAFSSVFRCVSDVCCKCFNCSKRMMQLFHLDVSKDWVLHLSPRLLLPHLHVSSSFSMLVMFEQCGPTWGWATWMGRKSFEWRRTPASGCVAQTRHEEQWAAWVGHESLEWCGTRASGVCGTVDGC